MKSYIAVVLAGVLFATTGIPVHAQDLLGGLLGGDGLGSVLNVDSGAASNQGLVNVGLGGGGGNILDVNLGGSSAPIADVSVSNNNGGLGVGADVLSGTATADIGVGGGSNLLTTNVGLGGDNLVNLSIGLPGSTPGTPGAPGTPGTNGRNGNNGNGVTANNGNNGVNGNNGINGNNSRGVAAACDGMPANQVTRLLQSTRFDSSWSRASGVKVQPIAVCSDVRQWLTSQLSGSNLGAALRSAVQSDSLVNASLSRTSYGADRVLAVKQSGSQLIVYVY
ncbi:hypothetical protein SAMN05428969_1645 [Devosia sp. YR412]|uniref:hypothetical protein n=1 Tax=Devosia sp. YR412 TaxID=1881030 RepID=UPI0008BD0745|nr:hypothetical protein [Devosia sp. YR412]SEQ03612.1 hypothetical protein SAMN05428969_1645 [Devosia sp. YR412]